MSRALLRGDGVLREAPRTASGLKQPSIEPGDLVEHKRLGAVLQAIQSVQAQRDEQRLASKKLTVRTTRLKAIDSFMKRFTAEQTEKRRRQNAVTNERKRTREGCQDPADPIVPRTRPAPPAVLGLPTMMRAPFPRSILVGICLILGCADDNGSDGSLRSDAMDSGRRLDGQEAPDATESALDSVLPDGLDAGDDRPLSDMEAGTDGAADLGDVSTPDLRSYSCDPDASSPSLYPTSCHEGSDGVCSDQGRPPVCIGGEWRCGTGPGGAPLLRRDQCKCFPRNTPPGQMCGCTEQGWQCRPIIRDAGVD